jgi:hypothetical protein
MKNSNSRALLAAMLFAAHLVHSQTVAIHPPNTFRIAVSSTITGAVSGRILLFMQCGSSDKVVDIDLSHPKSTWIAAQEVRGLAASSSVEFHADSVVYPKPFAKRRHVPGNCKLCWM